MLTTIIIAFSGVLVGGGLSWLIFQQIIKQRGSAILSEAEKEAEAIKKDKMLQAKERFLELKSEHEKEIRQRERKMQEAESRIKEKEGQLNRAIEENKRKEKDMQRNQESLATKLEAVERKLSEVERLHKSQVEQLEVISQLSAEDAKSQLVEALKEEAKTEAAAYVQNSLEEAKLTANQEAKKLVVQSIQRVATEQAIENAVSVFNIENDDVKGRIIGREGRNIRALEAATGVEIIVDDTPEAIILSCFDPVRREIARLSLHRLVTDGRIHPARIEEVVAKVTKSIDEEIAEIGKRTTIDLGIHGLHPELVKMVWPHEVPLFLRTKPVAAQP